MCLCSVSDKNKVRTDLSHPIHSDNCIIQSDNTCKKAPPAYVQRDYRFVSICCARVLVMSQTNEQHTSMVRCHAVVRCHALVRCHTVVRHHTVVRCHAVVRHHIVVR